VEQGPEGAEEKGHPCKYSREISQQELMIDHLCLASLLFYTLTRGTSPSSPTDKNLWAAHTLIFLNAILEYSEDIAQLPRS
jgi:hypothetical protein